MVKDVEGKRVSPTAINFRSFLSEEIVDWSRCSLFLWTFGRTFVDCAIGVVCRCLDCPNDTVARLQPLGQATASTKELCRFGTHESVDDGACFSPL